MQAVSDAFLFTNYSVGFQPIVTAGVSLPGNHDDYHTINPVCTRESQGGNPIGKVLVGNSSVLARHLAEMDIVRKSNLT